MQFRRLSPIQDRAINELRHGRPLILMDKMGAAVICAAIDTTNEIKMRDSGYVLLSAPRAHTLGYSGSSPLALPTDPSKGPEQLRFLMQSKVKVDLRPAPLPDFADALLTFAKQGRLIPAFYICDKADYICDTTGEAAPGLLAISASDLPLRGPAIEPQRVSTVPIPLHLGDQYLEARVTLYDTGLTGEEPLAISIGDPHGVKAPLVRLHSACLTGDVFGSLRCDCGPQLHKALGAMDAAGQGCLLYLPQEGRDTGLHNKLRAYALQDAGLDTLEADAALGFEPDERDFAMASALLHDLGLTKIRLLTNNPEKVTGLEAEGIKVVERVALQIPAQKHNHAYLKAKAERAGHFLP